MKITICDKCNNTVETYWPPKKTKAINFTTDIPIEVKKGINCISFDLCFNCLYEFTTWLKEKPSHE